MPDDDNDLPHIIPTPPPDGIDIERAARELAHAREQQKLADTYPGRTQLSRKLPPIASPEPTTQIIHNKDRRRTQP